MAMMDGEQFIGGYGQHLLHFQYYDGEYLNYHGKTTDDFDIEIQVPVQRYKRVRLGPMETVNDLLDNVPRSKVEVVYRGIIVYRQDRRFSPPGYPRRF